jgi:F-type H+-transporting ATPase subunit epsilon
MGKKLWCEVISPEQIVYSGEVDMVILRSVEGELGILPFHTPIITLLDIGEMRVKYDQKQEYIALQSGYLEVREDKVVVLANAAELASEIDVERAKLAKERAEAEIETAKEKGVGFYEAQKRLQWALTQLRVAEKAE